MLALLGVIGTIYVQMGLLNRIADLEAKMGSVAETTTEVNKMTKETQKKVAETGRKVEKIEENKIQVQNEPIVLAPVKH
jgi:uncharacterized coiled-coil protein SlyX